MDADALLAAADRALLMAKRTGKGRVAMADPNAEEELARLRGTELSPAAVHALAAAIDARDDTAQGSAEQVVGLATGVAMLLGMTADAVERIAHGALLHDVGKLAIPDEILRKVGTLDDAEWDVIVRAPRDRRGDPAPPAGAGPARADRAPRARALGRQRLSRRARGAADPDGLADHPRLRRLRGDDHARARTARRCHRTPRSPSCAPARARSSTPRSSARCSTVLGARG